MEALTGLREDWGEERPRLIEFAERESALQVLASAVAADWLDFLRREALPKMESPVEEAMLYGLIAACWKGRARVRVTPSWIADHGIDVSLRLSGPDSLLIAPQYRIGKARVDFKLSYLELNRREVDLPVECVVEVDGHAFHEKTKKQAQRDKERERAITGTGLPVLRFTGSEVWASPAERGEAVLDHLRKAYWRQSLERELAANPEALRRFDDKPDLLQDLSGLSLEEWRRRLTSRRP